MSALAQKVAIVTGAGNGIGRAIVEAFTREGARVVAVDLDAEGLAKTAELSHPQSSTLVEVADVSVAAHAQAAVERALSEFGSLHILVNGAARFVSYGPVTEVDASEWEASLQVNLTGPFLMSKYAVPAIARSGGGSIIHIASQLGQVGKPGICWYGAAKAALIQLAKIMAMDHVDQGIRVNSLSPGPIATERLLARYGGFDTATEVSAANTLMQRMGEPDEIAAAAVFLASDASSYMTGADLLVDGGYTAW